MSDTPAPVYLTIDEVAERWKVSGPMIRKLIGEGKLAKVNVGSLIRINLADVEAFEAANRKEVTA